MSAGAGPDPRHGGTPGAQLRLRLDLAYDGAPFAGFARQPDQHTVQGTLEGALHRCLDQAVATVCAGRTDRGVHALAQVVHVDVDPTPPRAVRSLADVVDADGRPLAGAREAAELRARLAGLVGPAIAVWRVEVVGAGFDARFAATERGYRYRLVDAPAWSPLARFDRWQVDGPLALGPMRTAARVLLGEHDFAAFCKRAPGRTTVRRLDGIAVSRAAPGEVHVRLRGPAFCHTQVRSIVGCLVEVGRGRWEPERVAEVLTGRDRQALARLAPPHGLTLERVAYGRRWRAAPPALTTVPPSRRGRSRPAGGARDAASLRAPGAG